MAVKQQEAAQTGKPFVVICEDEEKYFDQFTPELQLTAMAAVGMPDFGWTEIKNETTTDRACKLITNLGISDLLYSNGLAVESPRLS